MSDLDTRKNNAELADSIERDGINARFDFSILDKAQIIAALRRLNPVLGECEECGHTIVTPLKRLPESQPESDILKLIEALKERQLGYTK